MVRDQTNHLEPKDIWCLKPPHPTPWWPILLGLHAAYVYTSTNMIPLHTLSWNDSRNEKVSSLKAIICIMAISNFWSSIMHWGAKQFYSTIHETVGGNSWCVTPHHLSPLNKLYFGELSLLGNFKRSCFFTKELFLESCPSLHSICLKSDVCSNQYKCIPSFILLIHTSTIHHLSTFWSNRLFTNLPSPTHLLHPLVHSHLILSENLTTD